MQRRGFLKKTVALGLGAASAATGIFALINGRHIEPFLGTDANTLLQRFGPGVDLIDKIAAPEQDQQKFAKRVGALKKRADKSGGSVEAKLSRLLQEAIAEDFGENRVHTVDGWILSETELGIYLYQKFERRGAFS